MCYMLTKVILFFWCYKSFYEKLLRIVDSDGSWEMGDGSWEMEVFLRYTFNIEY
jgi:hypothetical protein